ncbi:hypothetical protein P5673_011586 [Acropora cervicornis]|uniref:Uncharacterized protein n=1 Tax=Acropora cervicornis TaxID=6130 RepID=A0AAD9QP22_ACRCE|nr:hypothetical protein P5673_011586 [Acropora cervicornis]
MQHRFCLQANLGYTCQLTSILRTLLANECLWVLTLLRISTVRRHDGKDLFSTRPHGIRPASEGKECTETD